MNLKLLSLKRISYILAKYIAENKNENHKQKYIYYYSLQIIISTITELTILFLAAWVLGLLKEVIVCLIVLIPIRLYAGGYHASTFGKCILHTLVIIIGTAAISKLASNYYSLILNIIFFTIVIIITLKYAPYDTPNRLIISKEYRKSLKIKSLVLNIIWFIISTYLLISNFYIYFVPFIGFSVLVASFTLVPWLVKYATPTKKCCASAHH